MTLHPAEVAAAASAVGATAAALSAFYSRRNVEHAHRPLVYGEPEGSREERGSEGRYMAIRLRNEGVGRAQDIRMRFEEHGSRWTPWKSTWTSETVQGPPVMRAGEVCPPNLKQEGWPIAIPLHVTSYASVVRYRDTFGRLWMARHQRTSPGRLRARRVRWRKRAW